MTHSLDRLNTPDLPADAAECAARASEARTIAVALRERAGVLRQGANGRAAIAIVELNAMAERLNARAAEYEGGMAWPR